MDTSDHRASFRKNLALTLAVLVALACMGYFVGAKTDTDQTPETTVGSKEALRSGERLARVSMSKLAKRQRREYIRVQRVRRSPQARHARSRSRTSYSNLTSVAALHAVKAHAATVLNQSAWTPPELKSGEKIVGFLDEDTARVDLPGEKADAFVDSLVEPIAVRDARDVLRPVDVSLESSGNGFSPARTKTQVQFPSDIAQGIRMGGVTNSQLKITPSGESSTAVLVEGGKKLFYANTQRDTDTILEATPTGAALSWALRSAGSPASLTFDLGENASRLQLLPDGSIEFSAGALGLGRVERPSAFDATGRPVESHYSVAGSKVTVVTEHASKDLRYPVTIDPVISIGGVMAFVDDGGNNGSGVAKPLTTNSGESPSYHAFAFTSSNYTNFLFSNTPEGTGARMKIQMRNGAAASGWGNLTYDAPNGATIFRARFAQVTHGNADRTTLRVGLVSPSAAWESQKVGWYGGSCSNPSGCWANGTRFESTTNMSSSDVEVCATTSCGMGGSYDNKAVFQFAFDKVPGGPSNTSGSNATTRGAYIYFSDYHAPTLTIFSTVPTQWRNRTADTLSLKADDTVGGQTGVGVGNAAFWDSLNRQGAAKSALNVFVDGTPILPLNPTIYNAGAGVGNACNGNFWNPCPQSYSTVLSGLWEGLDGIRNFVVEAADLVGQTTSMSATLKTDNEGPEVNISGRLGAFALDANYTGAVDVRTVVRETPFTIRAVDGRKLDSDGSAASPKDRRSGVKTISAKLYGSNSDGTINTYAGPVVDFDQANGGNPKQSVAADCDQNNYPNADNSCQLSYSGNFIPSALSPGIYYFKVTAKDWIDNTTNRTFKVAVGVASVEGVTEGQTTARYVPIEIERNSGVTAANTNLQFRTAVSSKWCTLPSSVLRTENDPDTAVSTPISFVSGKTPVTVVDLTALRVKSASDCKAGSEPLPDGVVYLRALLPGSGIEATRASEDVAVNLSRGGLGTDDETTDLGPGTLDLVTGNFAVSATDVSVDAFKSNLTLMRTFNSRYANDPDHKGVFGHGWDSGLPFDGSAAGYDKLIDYASVDLPEEERDAYVEIKLVDGDWIEFELGENANTYIPEEGLESLKLTRIPDAYDSTRTAGFKLYDKENGTTTVFDTRPDGTPRYEYRVTDSYQAGASDSITYRWKSASGIGSYPTFAFAPEKGTSCPHTNDAEADYASLTRGCQALRFNYTTDNAAEPRLLSVQLKNFDPQSGSNGAMTTVDIATYTYDSNRRLITARDSRLPEEMKTVYTYDAGGRLATIKNGATNAFTLTYDAPIGSTSVGSLVAISQLDGAQTATTNVQYGIKTQGSGAPFDFSVSEVDKWGQEHPPFVATAVFDAAHPPTGSPTSNYGQASLAYTDPLGRAVNTRSPGGRISTVEYDHWGNVRRTLSPENRKRALDLSTYSIRRAAALKWDNKDVYEQVPGSVEGRTHLKFSLGPEHEVRLASGSLAQARAKAIPCYDEDRTLGDFDSGSFSGTCSTSKFGNDSKSDEPFDLTTSAYVGALVGSNEDGSGGTLSDVRASAAYYGSSEAELRLGAARVAASDPGSGKLSIKRKFDFDEDGLEMARYQPRSQSSGQPSTTLTYYYVAGTSSDDSACSNHSEWRGLPCKILPGLQPSTSGLPKLPVKTITYNRYRQPLTITESVVDASSNTKTRTTTNTFDSAGRLVTEETTGSVGDAVRRTTHVYNTAGQEAETRSLNANGTTHSYVQRTFDSLGRQTGYRDADGNLSNTTYDILSRPVTETDPKATRTNSYDSTTGELSGVTDSGLSPAGSFNSTRDDDGQLTSEAMPGGLVKAQHFDEDGNLTNLTYIRVTDCSSACTWINNTAEYNIHGQMVTQAGLPTQSGATTSQAFHYDAIGRLSGVQDISDGQCETRLYAFDADSNRTAQETYAPASGGACSTSGTPTTKSHSYDSADRITDSGYQYDAFGRTTQVPQSDAGGTGNLSATYYVNDLARSITQNGKTQTIELDPMLRARTNVKSGSSSGTDTYAYSDDSDSPAWIASGSNWTRWVPGLDGSVAATQQSSGYIGWTISNIRGDMIGEAGGGGAFNVREIDEFGNVKGGLPASRPYGFHGSKVRETLTDGGMIAMGVRLYVPGTGRFLQTDPVLGGTANPYEYPSDPVGSADLDGRACYRVNSRYRRAGVGAKVHGDWCTKNGKIDPGNATAYSDCDIDFAGDKTGVTKCKGLTAVHSGIHNHGTNFDYKATVTVGNLCVDYAGCSTNVHIYVKATFRANGSYTIHYIDDRYKIGDKRRNIYRRGKAKCYSKC
jgi:RHS repeat-associated protein